MPYKSSSIKLQGLQDRRKKLQDFQYDEIKHKYSTGLYSLNNLAKEYGVSKKLILITVNPESKRKSEERTKEHWREYTPMREERNAIMREHRHYKQELYLKGELNEHTNDK